jgi:hypothetical protein
MGDAVSLTGAAGTSAGVASGPMSCSFNTLLLRDIWGGSNSPPYQRRSSLVVDGLQMAGLSGFAVVSPSCPNKGGSAPALETQEGGSSDSRWRTRFRSAAPTGLARYASAPLS